jgi:hypothetical protein
VLGSTETVKAVVKRDVFRSFIIGTFSSSSRCPVTGMQISPRPFLAMKLNSFRGDLLGCDSQIALVFLDPHYLL